MDIDYNGFPKYCHEKDEPVELTRNSKARLSLQSKLLVAEKQIDEGLELVEHDEVFVSMRRKIDVQKD